MPCSSTRRAAGPTRGGLPAPAGHLRVCLLAWYDANGRRLPWRAPPGAAPDPYRVLVSELMLQQTTVATVRGRHAGFLARFPDLASLAAAPLDDVLHAWQGLGYYRRARALHACARAVMAVHGGRLPRERAALLALPGIGAYTASALQAIAFGLPAVPIDGNVRRVLARLLALDEPPARALPRLAAAAAALAAPERAGDLAQALMDLGSRVCTPRRPDCAACPWRGACRAHALARAEELPRKAPARRRPLRRATAFLLRRGDGAILFRRRPEDGLLGGMIELPSSPWQEAALPLERALAHAPPGEAWRLLPGAVRHVLTHLAVELTLAEGRAVRPGGGIWCPPAALGSLALPTLTRKLLAHGGLAPPSPDLSRRPQGAS